MPNRSDEGIPIPIKNISRGTGKARALAIIFALTLLSACEQKSAPPQMPPPEVTVIKAVAAPVAVFEEYVGQTEAVDTVEIRSRVGGILERQAFRDGANVKKGGLLFVIDQQPYLAALNQAKAALAQAQASYLNSKQNLDRARPLFQEQAISRQDLDAAVAKERSDAASVEAARAQVKQGELNLEYTTIRAPRDGMISKALIKPGGLVNASTTLLTTLYSVHPMYVNFTVSEQKLLKLERQIKGNSDADPDAAAFKIKLADGSDYQYRGRLNFIDAAVDPKSGTLQMRIAVPNPDTFLRPGQFVRVIAPSPETRKAIRVPQQAVQELQGKHSVYVVGSDNKAIYREVEARSRVGNDWLVEGGLNPGDLVVVEGIQKAKPGMVVKPVLAQAAPGGVAADGAGAAPTGQPAAVKAGG